MSIGKNIKKLRKQCNMTQKQLSQKTGIAVITIQQYEAEKYNPKINGIIKLCAALDCKVTDLIDEDNQKYYYAMFKNVNPNINDGVCFHISKINDLLQKKENGCKQTETEEMQLHDFSQQQQRLDASVKRVNFAQKLYGIAEGLNESGQEKVIEHAEMIAKIPEYQKKPDTPPEE